jgi:hypothetical protein
MTRLTIRTYPNWFSRKDAIFARLKELAHETDQQGECTKIKIASDHLLCHQNRLVERSDQGGRNALDVDPRNGGRRRYRKLICY